MSKNNTPAKRSRSNSGSKPQAKKQRLSTNANLITAPNAHVYARYIDAKESIVLDNLDEINEDDVAEIAIAATDDIEFYKQAMGELQEKLAYCKTQVGVCGQLLGQMISRNASRLDLKKLLSPDSRKKAHNTAALTTPQLSMLQYSPVHSAVNDTPTSISSQLMSPAAQPRAQSNNTTPTNNANKTVTRSVSAANNNHVTIGDTNGKAARNAINTQISSDSTSSSEDEPQVPSKIPKGTPKTSPKPKPVPKNQLQKPLEANLFKLDSKVRGLTIQTSTYLQAHEMKPRSLIFNPHRKNNFTTASFDGSVKFWQLNENFTGDKEDDEEQMVQTGIITGKHMKHTRPPTDISWSKWEERLAILFPQAVADQKGTNCQLVLVEASRMPTVSGLFLNSRPHTKDPQTIRWVSPTLLVSGGTDHTICSWNVNYENKSCDTKVVHANHSSSVHAIHVIDDYLYSGGADKKLICWNLKTESEVQHLKFDEKITSITPCPAQEKIVLLNKMGHSNQLTLFDTRTSKSEMNLSYKTQSRNSVYITPSWETSGTWIACGSTDTYLNLWDLRYIDVSQPSYCWKMHKKRVFKAEFVPNENKILTLSSDRFLGCHSLAFD